MLPRARATGLVDELVGNNPYFGHAFQARLLAERILVQMGIRGFGLSPEIVRAVYVDLVGPRLGMVAGKVEIVTEYFSEDDEKPVPAEQVSRIPRGHGGAGRCYRAFGKVNSRMSWAGGYASANGVEQVEQVEQVEYVTERTREVPGLMTRTPLPMTPERFAKLVREAIAGSAPWGDLDELYTEPEPTFL